jgi:hypothetical protein
MLLGRRCRDLFLVDGLPVKLIAESPREFECLDDPELTLELPTALPFTNETSANKPAFSVANGCVVSFCYIVDEKVNILYRNIET